MAHRITLIPGDGIGPEVAAAAVRVLEATGVEIEWDRQPAGEGVFEREGTALPQRVLDSIGERGVALKGPLATPTGRGFRSPNVALRKELDLHTGVRPCKSLAGVPHARPGTDFVVVRMNHEDLYAGIEFPMGDPATERLRELVRESNGTEIPPDAGVSLKPLSVTAIERTAGAAFDYARGHGRRSVTVVHKSTVMRATDGLFLGVARMLAAREYPELELGECSVDTFCHRLVARPADHDVALLPMAYGDIVSDIGAALAGGLGMAPGANFGEACAVFEPVHGSAPKYAGTNRANPLALVLSGAMMLRHVGEHDAAARLDQAVADLVQEGVAVTFDLKASRDDPTAVGTSEVADALAAKLAVPVATG